MNSFCSDLLWLVFRFLEGDLGTLYSCSLANKEFNHAASKLLFRKVTVSPAFRPILDLKEKSGNSVSTILTPGMRISLIGLQISTQFSSSSSPRNAAHVLELEISGKSYIVSLSGVLTSPQDSYHPAHHN
jgi:hypothetical protein